MKALKFKTKTELLDWCRHNLTAKEKAFIRKHPFGKKPVEVYVFSADGTPIKRFDSMLDLEKELLVKHHSVRYCLKNNTIYKGQYYFSTQNVFAPSEPKERVSVYAGCNNKTVFGFGINGELVKTFDSATDAANWLSIPRHWVCTSIRRVSLVKGHYYLSYDENFELPSPKKYNRNPLLRPQ